MATIVDVSFVRKRTGQQDEHKMEVFYTKGYIEHIQAIALLDRHDWYSNPIARSAVERVQEFADPFLPFAWPAASR